MKAYNFSDEDCMWIFSHTGINNEYRCGTEAKKKQKDRMDPQRKQR